MRLVSADDVGGIQKKNYNREFQKGEVLRYLVRKEALVQIHQPLTISGTSIYNGSP
jgi:hypothetical protein